MSLIRIAALGCLSFLAGACTSTTDPSWRSSALHQDPLVHGPFLIGAPRPSVGTGCVRPGAVRSQDARSTWRPCATAVLLPVPESPVVVVEPLPPPGSYVVGPEAAAPVGPPPPRPLGRPRARSAWDG